METFCHQNLIRKGDALYSISCDLLIDWSIFADVSQQERAIFETGGPDEKELPGAGVLYDLQRRLARRR